MGEMGFLEMGDNSMSQWPGDLRLTPVICRHSCPATLPIKGGRYVALFPVAPGANLHDAPVLPASNSCCPSHESIQQRPIFGVEVRAFGEVVFQSLDPLF